jgi:Fe(3+) dicitrate transport protein
VFRRHWWRQSSNSAQRPNDSADPKCGGMANLSTTCGNEGRLRLYRVFGIEPRAHTMFRIAGVAAETDLGVRVHHERQERIQKNGDFPTARDGEVSENNQRLNTAFSAFAQQRLLFGNFTVTPGLRIEHVLYDRTNRLRTVSGTTSVTQLIPGIGVSHSLSANATWFAGLHRGFAPPRTEDVINNNTGGVIDLDPELSWNLELGTRTELRPGVKVDATLFRMDYENQVVPASVAGGVGATLTNGGETLHQGIEGSVRLDTAALFGLSQNVYLRGAFTYVPVARFEGTRFSNVTGFTNVPIAGNRLPYAPERLLTVGVGYSFASRFDTLIEAVHVSNQFGDDLNTIAGTVDGQRGLIPAHTTWNAAANYRLPKFDATLFVTVKNVMDTLYIADRSRGLLPGTPRLVQTGVKVRF